MKKILTIFAAASLFVACNSKSDLDTNKDVVVTDTTNMYRSNASTDISTANQPVEEEKTVAPTKIIRETRVVYIDRTPKATKPVVHEAIPNQVVTVPQTQTTQTTSAGNSGNTSTNTGNNTTIGSGTETTPSSEPVKEEKKGWSNAAKNATIGGAGGAVLGAIISKKKVKGAVIGGIIGAAGGYILGKKKDKAQDNTGSNYASY